MHNQDNQLIAAFLANGGEVQHMPRGATIQDPLSIPAGPLRDAAVERRCRVNRKAVLASPKKRRALREMLDRWASLAEVARLFGYSADCINTPFMITWQMREFGIEPPKYLFGAAPKPASRRKINDKLVEVLERIRAGSPLTLTANKAGLTTNKIRHDIDHYFGSFTRFKTLKSRQQMVQVIHHGWPTAQVEKRPCCRCKTRLAANGSLCNHCNGTAPLAERIGGRHGAI